MNDIYNDEDSNDELDNGFVPQNLNFQQPQSQGNKKEKIKNSEQKPYKFPEVSKDIDEKAKKIAIPNKLISNGKKILSNESKNENINQSLNLDEFKSHSMIPKTKEKNKSTKNEEILSIISAGTEITGDIITSGALIVEGKVGGNITAGTTVKILKNGEITGAITTSGSFIGAGKVHGDLSAKTFVLDKINVQGQIISEDSVTISEGSIILGDISSKSIVVSGAIKGNLDIHGPVILESSAIIKGDIKSETIQIKPGAAIDGNCSQCYAKNNPITFFD